MSDPDDDIGLDPSTMPARYEGGRGRGGGGRVTQHPRALDAERRAELRAALTQVEEQVLAASSSDLTSSGRIEKLLAINTTIIMGLLREALGEVPDLDRSTVLARALVAVKDTVAIVRSKHELEAVDSFNPRSPKFGIVFGWFIEMVHRVLLLHVDETASANFFNDLVGELSGWEDRIERQFKGVAGKALASMQSPFVESFRDQVRDASTQQAYLQDLETRIQRAEVRLAALDAEYALRISGHDGRSG